jgi:hypothetical protein
MGAWFRKNRNCFTVERVELDRANGRGALSRAGAVLIAAVAVKQQ